MEKRLIESCVIGETILKMDDKSLISQFDLFKPILRDIENPRVIHFHLERKFGIKIYRLLDKFNLSAWVDKEKWLDSKVIEFLYFTATGLIGIMLLHILFLPLILLDFLFRGNYNDLDLFINMLSFFISLSIIVSVPTVIVYLLTHRNTQDFQSVEFSKNSQKSIKFLKVAIHSLKDDLNIPFVTVLKDVLSNLKYLQVLQNIHNIAGDDENFVRSHIRIAFKDLIHQYRENVNLEKQSEYIHFKSLISDVCRLVENDQKETETDFDCNSLMKLADDIKAGGVETLESLHELNMKIEGILNEYWEIPHIHLGSQVNQAIKNHYQQFLR